jgi:hypothetical protein
MDAPSAHLPIDITYGTADGLLVEHIVKGDLQVSIAEDGTFWTTSIDFSDDQTCLNESDTIPYGWDTCAILKGITVQLGLSWNGSDQLDFSDEGVMVFEYHRGSTTPPGPADRLRILNLESKK